MNNNSETSQILVWMSSFLRKNSLRMTRLIALKFGDKLGFVYVGGYPRSGTTWLSQMISQYLDIPYADPYYLPIAFNGLIHHHWTYKTHLDNSFYLIRDGRDVMVSSYMHQMKGYLARKKALSNYSFFTPTSIINNNVGRFSSLNKQMVKMFGKNFDPWDLEINLPLFLEHELTDPTYPSVRIPWQKHIRDWTNKSKTTIFVRYEELLSDTISILASILEQRFGFEIDQELLDFTAKRFSFEKQSGRRRGKEDRNKFIRKGITGDWENHFSTEAREIFDYYAGDLLISLGYERDHRWVDRDKD